MWQKAADPWNGVFGIGGKVVITAAIGLLIFIEWLSRTVVVGQQLAREKVIELPARYRDS